MTTVTHYRNGLGTSALVLGIIALALSWIPVVNYVAVILGVIGLALGGIGLNQVRKKVANNPAVAAIGVALSTVAVVVSFVTFSAFVEDVEEGVNELTRDVPTFEFDCMPVPEVREC